LLYDQTQAPLEKLQYHPIKSNDLVEKVQNIEEVGIDFFFYSELRIQILL